MTAIVFLYLSILATYTDGGNNKERVIEYQGTGINTTFDVPEEFLGRYEGRRNGYLELRQDGTGTYHYDVFGFAPPSCERKPIEFIWGFILDENSEISKQERDYGYSYPVLLKSTGTNSFQGCRTDVMKDFILERGETLHVSSSDDWEKKTD